VSEKIARLEGFLVIASLWCMVVFTFFHVCLRGLYTKAGFIWANNILGSIAWSEDMVRMLVLWLSLIGASLLAKEGKHIRIDLFSNVSSPVFILLRNLVLAVASCLGCMIMTIVSISYLRLEISFGATMFLSLPSWLGQSIIPIAFSLMAFRYAIAVLSEGLNIKERG
jgi:TRAP-type C4-dicarboxylate transport system permease small subunit